MSTSTGKDAPKRLSRQQVLELVHLTSRHTWAFPVIVVLGIVSSFADSLGISLIVLFLYTVMGRSADAAEAGGPLGKFFEVVTAYIPNATYLALMVLGLILTKLAFSTLYAFISASVQNGISQDVRDRLHQQYLDVEYNYIRNREEGEMLKVLAIDSWTVSSAYRMISHVVVSAIAVFVMMAFLFSLSWQLTILAIIGAAALLAFVNLLAIPVRRLGRRTAEINQELAARTLYTLQGMRAIRAFGQEQEHQKTFADTSEKAKRLAVTTERLYAVLPPVTELGYLLLLASIAGLASLTSVPFASTLACVALLYRMQGPLRDIQGSVIAMAQMEAQLIAVVEVLRRTDKRYPRQGSKPFSHLKQEITFNNVCFRYNEEDADTLHGVSFKIPAGRTTALVGPSGSGKSTIVRLLQRLDEPNEGEILVDGTPLNDIKRKDWLRKLALAGQDVELMDSTVRANICVAKAEADDKALREAAKLAGVLDVIEALPYGMDNWIGPQGANFSGGERQRLGLARAILRDPEIFVLDEATSALDVSLEQTVRDNLMSCFEGRTIVTVTHRLTSILSVDHIICIEKGRVVEEGSPRELLARGSGAFSRMVDATPLPSDPRVTTPAELSST